MEARVDDPVHVEVEVVKLEAVGVWARGVGGHEDAVDDVLVLLDAILDDERVAAQFMYAISWSSQVGGEGERERVRERVRERKREREGEGEGRSAAGERAGGGGRRKKEILSAYLSLFSPSPFPYRWLSQR